MVWRIHDQIGGFTIRIQDQIDIPKAVLIMEPSKSLTVSEKGMDIDDSPAPAPAPVSTTVSGIAAPFDPSSPQITHVIFDMDGLMLDTESVYKQIYGAIIESHGKVYNPALRAQYMGMSDVDAAQAIIRLYDLPITDQEFLQVTHNEAQQRVPQCQLMPGFERLHLHLFAHGVPTALATSTVQPSFEMKTRNHGQALARFTHMVIGGSDPEVQRCKPAPDIFLTAARRFQGSPSPAQCLVFEDAVNGVQAAIAAGMPVIAVPDPEVDRSLFHGATQILNSLEEFRPELFGLPPF